MDCIYATLPYKRHSKNLIDTIRFFPENDLEFYNLIEQFWSYSSDQIEFKDVD